MDLSDTINDTINQIKQIENEIVFSLNKNHMKKFEPKKNEKNLVSYCDLLLENIRKQILWTEEYNNLNPSTEDKIELNKLTENSIQKHSNLEQEPVKKSEDLHSINLSNLSAHLKDSENHQDLKFDDDNLATNDETKSKKFFPNEFRSYETDYRISFYDNSNKFLIYFHNSKLVDTMCEDFCHLNDQSSCVNFSKLQIENNGRILPDYIENALLYLMKNGLNSIGIFRKSGVKSRINILKEQINQNIPIDFINSCVYDVADLVKNWLRELKPRLLTVELIDLFIKKEKTFNLWHLNDSHRYLLFTVLKFLSVVGSFHRQNQMNSSNLAICFAPSICDGENAKQIHRAQQCLQFCIENFESLFSPSVLGDDCGRISDDNNSNSNHHTSVLIINASPIDILHRLLYQRDSIDKLISRWNIENQTANSDVFVFDLQFSWLLPIKKFTLRRNWGDAIQDGISLNEIGNSIRSHWIMVPNGKGQTLVKHDIYLELRGFSSKWYQTVYSAVHDNQLKLLAKSFELNHGIMNASTI